MENQMIADFATFLEDLFLACDASTHRSTSLAALMEFKRVAHDKGCSFHATKDSVQPFLSELSRDARVYSPLLSSYTVSVQESPTSAEIDLTPVILAMQPNTELLDPIVYNMEYVIGRYHGDPALRAFRKSRQLTQNVLSTMTHGYRASHEFARKSIAVVTGDGTRDRFVSGVLGGLKSVSAMIPQYSNLKAKL